MFLLCSPDTDDAPVDGEGGVVTPGQRHDLPDVEDLPQRVGLGVVEGGALVPAWVVELSTGLHFAKYHTARRRHNFGNFVTLVPMLLQLLILFQVLQSRACQPVLISIHLATYRIYEWHKRMHFTIIS